MFSIEAPTGMSKAEWEKEKQSQAASVGLIGVLPGGPTDGGYFRIEGIVPGGPAEKAGLRKGDLILKIDGRSVVEMTFQQVVAHMRGPAGTTVHLTVCSNMSEREVTLVREKDPQYVGPNRREVFEPKPKRRYSRVFEWKHWDHFEKGDEILFTAVR